MGEALADPQIASRGVLHRHEGAPGVEGGFTVPVAAFKFAHDGPRVDRPPPMFGQHTDEVLGELGYSAADIARFRARRSKSGSCHAARRLGAWYSTDKLGGPQQIRQFVKTVERLGYDTLWYPESRGYESLSVAGFMLANTTKLKLGSSIASIYARDAFTSRRGMLSLQSLYGDRFILGLGVSHVPMVEGVRGHKYEKPVPAMRAYLDGITKGEAGSDSWPIAIAALGPLMLKLSADHTRGALPYNTTPQHTAEAARILGPDKWLVAEQKVTLETDPARRARSAARSCRATWCSTTTATTGCAWASPRPNWPTAAPTGSSTRWCCGAPPTRSAKACALILPPVPRMSASSRCTRTATPPRATVS